MEDLRETIEASQMQLLGVRVKKASRAVPELEMRQVRRSFFTYGSSRPPCTFNITIPVEFASTLDVER